MNKKFYTYLLLFFILISLLIFSGCSETYIKVKKLYNTNESIGICIDDQNVTLKCSYFIPNDGNYHYCKLGKDLNFELNCFQ